MQLKTIAQLNIKYIERERERKKKTAVGKLNEAYK